MIQLLVSLIILLSGQPQEQARTLTPGPEPTQSYIAYIPRITAVDAEALGRNRTIFGIAAASNRIYEYIPYYNWTSNDWQCTSPTYMPMLQSNKPDILYESCNDGRWLLLENEPELARLNPLRTVQMLNHVSHVWKGGIACCGTFYDNIHGVAGGVTYVRQVIDLYIEMYGVFPPIDALAIHIYEYRQLNRDKLIEWRRFADEYGLKLFVTEAGTFPSESYPPEEIAAELPEFLDEVIEVSYPDMILWFSDFMSENAFGDGVKWENSNLIRQDGTKTVVGISWDNYTNSWRNLVERFAKSD